MVMKVLKEIISKLNGYDPNTEYFDFNLKQRNHIVSVLWDEVYGNHYISSLKGLTGENPLKVQYETLHYLNHILKEYEEIESYELCDIAKRLIDMTENKIQKIDIKYANSINKSRGE